MTTRRDFAKFVAATGLGLGLAGTAATAQPVKNGKEEATRVQLIRSATVKITVGGAVFLIDPMLSPKGTWPGFAGTVNSEARNPLIDLPMSVEEILRDVDAVVLTHIHEDHWDEGARKLLPKDLPIFINDEPHRQAIMKAGFTNVTVLDSNIVFKDVRLSPMLSQHGTDEEMHNPELGAALDTTMGVLFEKPGCRSVYLVGDSVWKPFVSDQIGAHRPDVIVLNTGNALMTEFPESIIMGTKDFVRAYREASWAKIVAVHMDAINHCVLRRHDLRAVIKARKFDLERALVPDDGEILTFA